AGFQGCVMPTPEVDETGILDTTFELREDLPVEELTAPLGRRYFWRVRACDEAMAVCSDWSEVRYLDVGRLKEDVNGDGYADLVAASGQSLWFVPGAADFSLDSTVSAKPVAPEVIRLHSGDVKLRFVGDVDGDGFNDLTASADLLGDKQLVTQALLVHGGPAFEEGNAMTIGIGRSGDGNVSLYSG